MSKFKPTDDQKKAIEIRDKNIIVSAAAGSGKTRVLVDRVVSLMIEEKIPIKNMIIVTFTNKASVEMKDRIREKLSELLDDEKIDSSFVKKQIKAINDAFIKTLHSFCADMLRENFYLSDNLSPSFKIAADSKQALLRKDAIDELFENEYEKNDQDFIDFLHNFAKEKDDNDAKEIVLDLYDFSKSQVDPENWIKYHTSNKFDFSEFKKIIEKKVDDIIKNAEELKIFIEEKSMRKEFIQMMDEDLSYFNNLKKSVTEDEWDDSLEKIDYNLKAKTRFNKKKDDPNEDLFVKTKRNYYKDQFTELKDIVVNTDSITKAFFDPKEEEVLAELKNLVFEFEKIYKNKKREENYLDFSDMEHEFIKLLENDDLVEKLQKQFKYIFFDEYQDSNDIQNYIVDKLKNKNNLFFVGDVKQSIYGFRNARPELFLEKLESYEKDSDSVRINLSKNFRTDKDLIDFNNYIFDRLMTKKNSDISYKDDNHRLNYHFEFDEKYPKVSIKALNSSVNEEEYLIKEIDNLINSGMNYKDIAILLRSSSRAYLIENELKKAGIPFSSDISKISFETVEVDFFINILKYIANPKDDLTLLSVLRSEIFDFSEDELSLISLSSDKKYFYEKFSLYEENFNDELSQKISDFNTTFTDFSYILNFSTMYDFANIIFEKSGYYDFLKARDRGYERVQNIEAFIELMDDYDKNNENSLFGFLTYIDNLKNQKKDNLKASRNLSDEEDLVRIMTIHKSKGLEFKAVILPEASKGFNTRGKSKDMLLDKDLGIGINISDWDNKIKISSIKRDLILEKLNLNDKKEEMRVLYVALTRAERKLSIIGQKDLNEKGLDKIISSDSILDLSSYMDWILKILLEDKIMADFIDLDYKTDNFKNGALKIDYIEGFKLNSELDFTDVKDMLDGKNYDEKIYKNIKDIFSYSYKNLENTNKSLKKSVTEIAKNYDLSNNGYEKSSFDDVEISHDFRRPNFDQISLSPTQKGTLIHKIFQELEFKEYDLDSLKNEIDKLIDLGKIKKEYLSYLNFENILGFFNSKIIKDIREKSPLIRKEESFLRKIDNFYVNGQIDIMFEFEDQIILMDFKTDSYKREGFYDKQLEIYKDSIEEALGKKVSKSYIYWYNFKEFEQVNKNHR
ncbi:MAG: UvrD-helicase domain-containing protein [Anaerococcus hydrogenalis]|uniref:UvrD-helicase domain-containing protein n=1 Tax=Anaerococcus hydrogenalis TaxID=33029 RepID=UPI00290112AB|nr:UvrD-helicase domain-containing protein [Anaerococcus hydrogenalis]MDU2582946.1 UvrD-helicase domain-containing protein [Anaerococcus hydrogenalis]